MFTDPERGCLAYFKIPGTPLLDVSPQQRSARATSIAAKLGEFLSTLHAAPLAHMADLVDRDELPLDQWLSEAAHTYSTIADRIPPLHRPPAEAFLAATPPADPDVFVFSHNDLGIEHILVDPTMWTVTGVIDWSDAAIVDRSCDFGRLYRDLGSAAVDAAVGSYRNVLIDRAALRERALFYARCTLFEDLAYGVEAGNDNYASKSLAALRWLLSS